MVNEQLVPLTPNDRSGVFPSAMNCRHLGRKPKAQQQKATANAAMFAQATVWLEFVRKAGSYWRWR
jgi:hypothetical protein